MNTGVLCIPDPNRQCVLQMLQTPHLYYLEKDNIGLVAIDEVAWESVRTV